MNILALDTSTKNFSLAVIKKDRLAATCDIVLDKVLSDSIVPTIDRVLKKAGVAFEALDGFAVGLGPGSFTSLRVGLSTVKGFCLESEKKAIGISSLDLIAHNIKDASKQDICVIVDAKRSLVYAGIFRKSKNSLKQQGPYHLLAIEDLLPLLKKDTIFVGDAIGLYRHEIERYFLKTNIEAIFALEKYWLPKAEALALLALERLKANRTDDIDRLVPLYLYKDDCQVTR